MASKGMRDCRNMQFIKWNLRLGCPTLSNTQRQKNKKSCIFWRATGFFRVRLKSPEKIQAAIMQPRPYILFGLSVRPGPF